MQEILTEINPIDMPTEKEKAEVENLQAQAASAYVADVILSPEEVRKTSRMEKGGEYTDIDEELPAEEVPEDLHLPDDDDDGHNPPPKGMDSVDWDESKHSRDDDGKFSTGNSNGNNPEEKEKDKLAKQADCQNQLLAAINNLKENEEVGVLDLRDDLKQYGVTNDTALKGGIIMLMNRLNY